MKNKQTNEAISLSNVNIPTKSIQKILKLTGGFADYDVLYDDKNQCKYLEMKAKRNNVVLNNGKGLSVDANLESCAGTIESCIKYLKDYIDADSGFIAAQALYFDDPKAFTDEEFTYFCVWMNVWQSDWINGIKFNDQLKNRLMLK